MRRSNFGTTKSDEEPVSSSTRGQYGPESSYDEIVKNVEMLLKLNNALKTETNATKREQMQGRIAYAEQRINELVYELYDLTPDEIKIVEGQSWNLGFEDILQFQKIIVALVETDRLMQEVDKIGVV